MQFSRDLRDDVITGDITVSFRLWRRPKVKAGGRYPVGPARIEPELDLASAQALFLAPGVGAQGATPEDVARVFAACPDRVMPSASRSLLLAGPDIGALQDRAAAMAAEFRRLLPDPGNAPAARTL